MKDSLVSLIMPCFIRDKVNLAYFAQALQSAASQTYPALEILVIDDGSPLSDDVQKLPELDHSRFHYIHKQNGGVASALNVGLKRMQGGWFTWLSHDDLYLPGKIAEQMDMAMRMPDRFVFYCDVEHIDQDGNHLFLEDTPVIPDALQYVFHAQCGCFNANSYLIHRRCFDAVGEFDESLRTTQDNHMWFRIARRFSAARVPQVLMKYRHHPTQDSRSPIHLRECNELYIYFLKHVSRDEIRRVDGPTPGRYFAECACCRRNRGYQGAEWYAIRLAIKELLRHPFLEWKNRNFILGLILGHRSFRRASFATADAEA
jgi:glycosyltransferase involved in cell wall biosynthesis